LEAITSKDFKGSGNFMPGNSRTTRKSYMIKEFK
jgi:hypothetical protein